MTLQQVATLSGVSISYLSRAENGQVTPSADWVRLITAAIGTQIIADAESAVAV